MSDFNQNLHPLLKVVESLFFAKRQGVGHNGKWGITENFYICQHYLKNKIKLDKTETNSIRTNIQLHFKPILRFPYFLRVKIRKPEVAKKNQQKEVSEKKLLSSVHRFLEKILKLNILILEASYMSKKHVLFLF